MKVVTVVNRRHTGIPQELILTHNTRLQKSGQPLIKEEQELSIKASDYKMTKEVMHN